MKVTFYVKLNVSKNQLPTLTGSGPKWPTKLKKPLKSGFSNYFR